MKASRHETHDANVVAMLKADPDFANEYLAAALEEAQLPGGQSALLDALRHIAEAQGMTAVAARAGIPRESLYRALSPKGNPKIKTFLAVVLGMMRRPGRPLGSGTKTQITLRLDADVVNQFKATGSGWQTRINDALKSWVKMHA